jgi:hypothetical protein
LTDRYFWRYESGIMAKYIARRCPKCRDYFGVVVNQEPRNDGEHPITAYCAVCGYQLKGWRLVLGHKQSLTIYHNRKRSAIR